MVAADPGQELETGVLSLVEDEVEEDGRDPLVLENVAGLVGRGGYRRPVTEILEVDAQLLQHRRLVLDHEHRRAEDVGGAVDLQARRQRGQPHLTLAVGLILAGRSVVFQGWL